MRKIYIPVWIDYRYFTNSPLNVQPNRATDMQNFITYNGVNRKRFGWEEHIEFYELDINGDRIYQKINGVFEQESQYLLQRFFTDLRRKKKTSSK